MEAATFGLNEGTVAKSSVMTIVYRPYCYLIYGVTASMNFCHCIIKSGTDH
jgi:hypothetical protein